MVSIASNFHQTLLFVVQSMASTSTMVVITCAILLGVRILYQVSKDRPPIMTATTCSFAFTVRLQPLLFAFVKDSWSICGQDYHQVVDVH